MGIFDELFGTPLIDFTGQAAPLPDAPEPINPIPLTEVLKPPEEPVKAQPPPPEPPELPDFTAQAAPVEPPPTAPAPSAPPPTAPARAWERLGVSEEEWDAYRRGLQSIESKGKANPYGIMGGSSGRFAGAYQMGRDEIAETARFLGEKNPTRSEFLNDPELQERFLDGYTQIHDDYLARSSPAYAQMSPREKLKVLGYAWNQGRGNAGNWLATGAVGHDAFGTPGTAFYKAVGRELDDLDNPQVGVDYDPNAPRLGAMGEGAEPEEDVIKEMFSRPPADRRAYMEQKIHETLGIPLDLRAPAGTLGVGDEEPLADDGMPTANPMRGKQERLPGLIEPGNIDLASRPRVTNPDGSISTVRSISVNVDGYEVVIPTVSDDGRILSNDDAVAQFKASGHHLGIFENVDTANAYAEQLHKDEEAKLAIPDFTAQAEPVTRPDNPVDFTDQSSFHNGDYANNENADPEMFTLTPQGKVAWKGAKEAGKGVVRGAANTLGTSAKGAAALENNFAYARKAALEKHKDFLTRYPTMTAENSDEIRSYINDNLNKEDLLTRYVVSDALNKLKAGTSLEEIMAAPIPIEQLPTFQAGANLQKGAEEAFPADKEWAGGVTTTLSEGIGSLLGGLPAAALNPVAGAAVFTTAGMGEAADNALDRVKEIDAQVAALKKSGGTPEQIAALEAKRPTPEQIATAGLYGVVPGATDILPVETLLGAIKIPTPFRKPIAKYIAKVGGQAFIEGFQEGGQQFLQNIIAQKLYEPEQALGEGVLPNTAAGAGVGALAEGVMGLIPGKQHAAHTQPQPQPQPVPAPATQAAPSATSATSATPAGPGGPGGPGESGPADESTDILLRAGWSQAYIDRLTPESRARAAEEEVQAGTPRTAPIYNVSPEPQTEAGAPQETAKKPAFIRDIPDFTEQAAPIAEAKPQKTAKTGGFIREFPEDEDAAPPDAGAAGSERENAAGGVAPEEPIQGGLTGGPGTKFVRDLPEETAPAAEHQSSDDEVGASKPPLEAAPATVTPDSPKTASEIPDFTSQAAGGKSAAAGLAELFGKKNPVNEETPPQTGEDLSSKPGEKINTPPTEAQAAAGNYKKERRKLHGLDIAIETPKGAERKGKGEDGTPWSVTMPVDYGYIERSVGADREPVDVYIGDNPDQKQAFYLVQQNLPKRKGGPTTFDEHKVMMGFDSVEDARAAYVASFSDGRGEERIAAIHPMSVDDIQPMLDNGQLRKRPTPGKEYGATKPAQNIPENIPAGEKSAETGAPLTSFTTAKGSTYDVHEDGTTTRSKALRDEHPGDQGLKPRSERTFYVSADDALKIGPDFQAQGGQKRIVAVTPDGKFAGVQYVDGKDKGKFERRTLVPIKTVPEVGSTPVEVWKGGSEVHFGNAITAVSGKKSAGAEATAPVSVAGSNVEEASTTKPNTDAKAKVPAPSDANADIDKRLAEIEEDLIEAPPSDRKILEDQRAELEAIRANNEKATKAEAGPDLSPENVYKSHEVETDDGETLTQYLTHKGPWDFNDTYPAPKADLYDAYVEQRGPLFGETDEDGGPDVEQVSYTFEESLGELQEYMHERNALSAEIERAQDPSYKPPKKNMTRVQWIEQLTRNLDKALANIDDVAATYADVFGNDVEDAIREEGERRVEMEKGSAPQTTEMQTAAAVRSHDKKKNSRTSEEIALDNNIDAHRATLEDEDATDEEKETSRKQLESLEATKALESGKSISKAWGQVSASTLAHYAKGYGVEIKGKTRAEVETALKAKGAKPRQHGGIISNSLEPDEVPDLLVNPIPIDEKIWDKFIEHLKAHTDEIEERGMGRDENDQGWTWRISVDHQKMSADLANYGDGQVLVNAITYDNGGASPTKKSMTEFARAFIKENPIDKSGGKSIVGTTAVEVTEAEQEEIKKKGAKKNDELDTEAAAGVDPEQIKLAAQVAELVKQVKPLDANFAAGMIGAHNAALRGKLAIKPGAIDFYKEKLEALRAQAGEAKLPEEDYRLENILEPSEMAAVKLVRSGNRSPTARVMRDGEKALARLVKAINGLGHKVSEARGEAGTQINALKTALTGLAGALARVAKQHSKIKKGWKNASASKLADSITSANDAIKQADAAIGGASKTEEATTPRYEIGGEQDQRAFRGALMNTAAHEAQWAGATYKLTSEGKEGGWVYTREHGQREETFRGPEGKRWDAKEAVDDAVRRAFDLGVETTPAAAKLPSWAENKLKDYSGVQIDGYEGEGEDADYPLKSVKRDFLQDGRNYWTQVSKLLKDRGFGPPVDKKGKPDKVVSVNKGGPATSGEISFSMFDEHGNGFWAQLSQSSMSGKAGVSILARRSTSGDRYGTKGHNQWPSVRMTVAEMADFLEKISGHEKKQAGVETTPEAKPERKRLYPSYTTQQLLDILSDRHKVRQMGKDAEKRMREEVRARESGESKPKVTPQIVPPKAETKTDGKTEAERPPIQVPMGITLDVYPVGKNSSDLDKALGKFKAVAIRQSPFKSVDAFADTEYEAQLKAMMRLGGEAAQRNRDNEKAFYGEAGKPGPSADEDRFDALKKKVAIFASGMSRIGDLSAGTFTWGGYKTRGIGVDVGELSGPGIAQLAKAIIEQRAQVFVDSGAFSLFKQNLKSGDVKALDFDKILAAYDKIEEEIERENAAEETDYPRPIFVMPDVVGDQAASLELVAKYKDWISTEAKFNVSEPMVPIQKGELSLSEAYDQIVDTLGTDNFIVGIPSNEKAVTNAELAEFLKESKPRKVHFLGTATDTKLDPKLQAIVDAGYTPEHVSADANVLRGSLYGRQDIEGGRKAGVNEVLGNKTGDEKQGGETYANEKRKLGAKQKKPVDAIQFLRSIGGLKDTGGNLKSMGVIKRIPGLVNNNSGRPFDKAIVALVDAGYLPQEPTDRPSERDDNTILKIVEDHLDGKKLYSAEDQGAAEELNAAVSESDRREELIRAIEAEGFELREEEIVPALELYEQGVPVNEIAEQIARAYAESSDADVPEIQEALEEIPFDAPETGTTREDGDRLPESGAQQGVPAGETDAVPGGSETLEGTGKDGDEKPAQVTLAYNLATLLAAGKTISHKTLQNESERAYGGTLADGTFDRKKSYDALELAVNIVIRDEEDYRVVYAGWERPAQQLEKLLSRLPTQTVRSEEQKQFQQFSTPPHYAMAVAYVANLQDGDVMLEPTAGTGSLIAAASRPGVTFIANELAENRSALLQELVGDRGRVFNENAEQLDNILPQDAKPTVVVMNPPFSQTAGRMGDKRDINVGAQHIEQALARLEPGGRLVAIVGQGMSMDAPRFKAWWAKIQRDNTVRANIGVDGKVYAKYGTSFSNRVLVIDKVQGASNPTLANVDNVNDLMKVLEEVRGTRPTLPAQQSASLPGSTALAGEGKGTDQSVSPPPADTGAVGAGERGGGGVAPSEQARPGNAGRPSGGLDAGTSSELDAGKSERPGEGGAGAKPSDVAQPGKEPGARGGPRTERDLESPEGSKPGVSVSAADAVKAAIEARKKKAAEAVTKSEAPTVEISNTKAAKSRKASGGKATVAKSAAKHAAEGTKSAAEGLAKLFGGKNKLSVGFTWDEETWKAAKPLFLQAASEYAEAAKDVSKLAKLLIDELMDKFAVSIEAIEEMEFYLTHFVEGVQTGAIDLEDKAQLEQQAPGSQANTDEFTDSLYEPYKPSKVNIKGAQPHPGPLVQSAAMAAVDPPDVTYKPNIPNALIAAGDLSLAQLETVVYAGQSHERLLPASEEGAKQKRRGFFIGDGTGVGKGREISGIILDNWRQGRTKAIWVSEKEKLMNDAKRDWSGLRQDDKLIFNLGKTKTGDGVDVKKGIGFITYDTLKGGMSDQEALARGSFVRRQRVLVDGAPGVVVSVIKGKRRDPSTYKVKLDNGDELSDIAETALAPENAGEIMKSRIDQIVEWVGEDFDGVIAFDEAHNMGNAVTTRGSRGMKEAAKKALAGLSLQERLPNARIVYVSATGATEVSNLAYATRLGLWGRGTAFAGRAEFIGEVESGGIAAMELIARDMKQMGLYTARNLSFDGVEYERLEHVLDTTQREIYDTLADAWQVVLRNINEALALTGGDHDRNAKSAAMSAFWGSHQRFFNQIITSMQMPSVIAAVEKDLNEGRQVVLQLTNTNEASQERAAAKATTAEELEELDITPRDAIIQLVERSFPTQQYEEYTDDEGNEGVRAVFDSEGKPVQNQQALRMRDALIERLASVRVPQGPLDYILDHFGSDVVAEVTGRKRRFVMKLDDKGNKRRVEESRPGSTNQKETDLFQGGKRKILVFSEAGGTGASYHADNTSDSKNARRSHYLVQAGWRADKAVQGFGRTHRTNQASAPIFTLVTTDLKGQKRFVSSIARRLAQLGALTKGQRQAGDQGLFSARDNLESHEADLALDMFFRDLYMARVDGVSIDDFEAQTGLKLRQTDKEGAVLGLKEELPPIQQFLNRLLSLKYELQNRVFDEFSNRLDEVIRVREESGRLDLGLETVRADKISKIEERVVYTMPDTGAETRHVVLRLADKFHPIPMEALEGGIFKVVKWVKSPKGKVWAAVDNGTHTETRTGHLLERYKLVNPVTGARYTNRRNVDDNDKWVTLTRPEAKEAWGKEIAAAPEYLERDMHMITGAILPIWDRLKGSPRVVRLQTGKERLIGRIIPTSMIEETLKALGVNVEGGAIEAPALFDALNAGSRAELSNAWRLYRSFVAGEWRIELIGPSSYSEGDQVKADGVFTEVIQYKLRYFVPNAKERGTAVLAKLIEHRPVTTLGDPAAPRTGEGDPDDVTFLSAQPSGRRRVVAQGNYRYTKRDGKDFVVLANGGVEFGRISKEIGEELGEPGGPIMLPKGFHKGDHIGFGEVHIEAQHGDTIREVGYADAAELVADVAKSFDEIRDDGKGRHMLVKWRKNGKSAFVVILWSKPGNIWNVITAGIYNRPFVERKKLLWESGAPSRLGTNGTPILREGQSDSRSVGPPGTTGKPTEVAQAYPPFYSALLRAAEAATTAKATPGQWMGTLRNAAGVKQEELDWIGVGDWLLEQKGAVTKEAITDFIRANQVTVEETLKGEGVGGKELEALTEEYQAWLDSQELPQMSADELMAAADLYDEIHADEVMLEDEDNEGEPLGDDHDSQGVHLTTPQQHRLQEFIDSFDRAMGGINYEAAPYERWQLPGGKDYRVLLLRLPQKFDSLVVPEQLTSLPEGYEVIHDSHQSQGRQYGITPPGQMHAAPLGMRRYPTADAARAAELQILNHERNVRAADEWRERNPSFQSSHFPEPNIVAHVRFNERTDADGKRTLFLEEIQSDWHQKGRKQGYADPKAKAAHEAASKKLDDAGYPLSNQDAELAVDNGVLTREEARAFRQGSSNGVPDAPFKTSWNELALKRMIRWAAEKGYDQIAWTPGAVQADRYDLSKQISDIRWSPQDGVLTAHDSHGDPVINKIVTAEELPDVIGKDAADKLINSPTTKKTTPGILSQVLQRGGFEPNTTYHYLSGVDLKVGGEGMLGFYDKILPAAANKLGKKFGAKVGTTSFGKIKNRYQELDQRIARGETLTPEEMRELDGLDAEPGSGQGYDGEVWSLPITDAMREGVMRGQALFKKTDPPPLQNRIDRLPPKAPSFSGAFEQRKDEIMAALEIAARIGGPIEVQLHEKLSVSGKQSGYAQEFTDDSYVGGIYSTGDLEVAPLIRLSMEELDLRDSSAHETYHHVEFTYATERELTFLNDPRVLERIKAKYGGDYPGALDGLGPTEIRAWGFQRFRRLREEGASDLSGLPAFLTNLWERMAQVLERVRNYLNDIGFQTVEDIWDNYRTGEVWKSREATPFTDERAADLQMFSAQPPKQPPQGFDFGPDGKLQQVIPGAEQNQKQMLELRAKAKLKGKKAQEGPESLGGLFGDGKKQTELFMARPAVPAGIPPATVTAARYKNIQRKLDVYRVYLQDKFLPVRRAQEEIEEEIGAPLPTSLDVYVSEALYHGRAGERMLDLDQKIIEPILEELRAAGIDPDDFGDYLYARHATERNIEIAEINEDMPEGGSGMDDLEAERILDEVARDPQRAVYEHAAVRVDRMQRQTRALLLRAGLIDQETHDAWRDKYTYYVPLRGFEAGDEDENIAPRTGRGFDIKGPEAMKALGRRSKADNPLVYAVMQAQQAIIRAEKNKVWNTMHDLVTTHPKPDLWKVYKGETKRRQNPRTGMVETYFVRPPYVKDEHLFAGKIDGKPVYIEVKNPRLARALRGTGNEIFGNPITRSMQTLARGYASLLTSYNPEFILTNLLRDVQTALINITDLEDKPEGVRRAMVKDLISAKAIRGAMSAMRGDGTSEYAPWFNEYRLAGGKVSPIGMNDVDRIKKRIETSVRQGDMRRAFRSMKKVVEDFNTAVENGVRLSTYVALRKAGVSQERAAYIARDLTVNFDRKGELGPLLNSLYIFFNASAQGSVRIAQAFGRSKTVRYTAAGLFAAGFMSALVNSLLLSGDDDDGENAYDNIPSWIKERNWIIMIPGTAKYLMVPMPYGWNVPMYAGQQLFSAMRGTTTALESAANVGGSALESFNPIGVAASFWQMVSPTLFDPYVQTQEGEGRGKTWFGGPIYPPKYNKFQPNSELVKDAPQYMQDAAKFMNKATGGNEARSGYVDVSPETIQHYAEFALGGVGKFLMNAVQTGGSLARGEEWLPEKTPFIRRLYSQQTSVAAKADFYRAWEDVSAAQYEVTQLRRDGYADQAEASAKRYGSELAAYPRMKEAHDLLDSLRSQRETVKADESLSGNAERDKIAEIVTEEKRVIAKSMKNYATAEPDPAIQEMLRLGVSIGTPTDAISGQTLDNKQFEFYQYGAARLAQRGLAKYMADPRWEKADDAHRTKIMEGVVRKARDIARQAVIERFPDIKNNILASKKEVRRLRDGEANIIRSLWTDYTSEVTVP